MTVKIVGAQDAPAYDADGQLVRFRFVLYTVDELGPFGLSGPATELTPDEIRRRIREDATHLRALTEAF